MDTAPGPTASDARSAPAVSARATSSFFSEYVRGSATNRHGEALSGLFSEVSLPGGFVCPRYDQGGAYSNDAPHRCRWTSRSSGRSPDDTGSPVVRVREGDRFVASDRLEAGRVCRVCSVGGWQILERLRSSSTTLVTLDVRADIPSEDTAVQHEEIMLLHNASEQVKQSFDSLRHRT